ncbi:MAG: histidine kinase [Akkermansiaceae bacterium]
MNIGNGLLLNGTRTSSVALTSVVLSLSISFASAQNPIGKVARVFNPRLVKVEERVEFLSQRLMTLAVQNEHHLDSGLGTKGIKVSPESPDPSCTIDLGAEYPIDSLFLIPAQNQSSNQRSIFPKGFRLDFSKCSDFSDVKTLYRTGNKAFPDPAGKPVKFTGQDAVTRYVRITVTEGHKRGDSEIFGLAELVVISDGYPVSFAKDVTSVGDLDPSHLWYSAALTDGRMPYGIWQGGAWNDEEASEFYLSEKGDDEVSWRMDFPEARDLDLLILYPVGIEDILDASVLPQALEIQAWNSELDQYRTVKQWKNPSSGSDSRTPLTLSLEGVETESLRIVATEPSKIGNQNIYGLSEIEVWSDQENISEGIDVCKRVNGTTREMTSLTDGFASKRRLIPVSFWLSQLHERWRVEREIEALRPMRAQMAAESELNATWGSAMMLGLTFLIPVFIVERRRLISKHQVDQLRKRIASDLHDDIGSNLGSISLIARTARKDLIRLQGPREVGTDLNEVESIAKESSLAMRDIVWLLERKQDTIGDLVSRIRETASRLLRDFDYTIDCDSKKVTSKLSLDAKRHLFLFYKEAIHNVLKHSEATKVSIRLWDQGDKLALEIVDNGKGIPKKISDDKRAPKGVRKLDERARVLEGRLDVNSTEGKGTRLLLTVKRSFLVASAPTPS